MPRARKTDGSEVIIMPKKKKEELEKVEPSDEAWEEEEGPVVEKEEVKEVIDTSLEGEKVLVFEDWEKVFEPGYYGKQIGDRLELSFVEACLLLKRGRIRVLKGSKALTFEQLYKTATEVDNRFPHRYRVYEDLRERGLLVRTGFKFGVDFRVYERGVKLIKGPKASREHTKWIVFAVAEDFTQSFQELSRAVRLAHNIRARMLWAVVDNEGDCTYYEVLRMKP